MNNDVRVVGVTLVDRQQRSGAIELALFDVVTDRFVIRGCLILLMSNGFVRFSAPRLAHSPESRAVEIIDPALQMSIIAAGVAAYKLLGGLCEVRYPAPGQDPEAKLLRDLGLVPDDVGDDRPSKRAQFPAAIIEEVARRSQARQQRLVAKPKATS